MAATFASELVTPERVLFEGETEMVALRTVEGESAFLANHAPFVAQLVPSVVRFIKEDGSEERAAVHGGFVRMDAGRLAVMAEVAELSGEIDVDRARARMTALDASPEVEGEEEEIEQARARAQARIDAASSV